MYKVKKYQENNRKYYDSDEDEDDGDDYDDAEPATESMGIAANNLKEMDGFEDEDYEVKEELTYDEKLKNCSAKIKMIENLATSIVSYLRINQNKDENEDHLQKMDNKFNLIIKSLEFELMNKQFPLTSIHEGNKNNDICIAVGEDCLSKKIKLDDVVITTLTNIIRMNPFVFSDIHALRLFIQIYYNDFWVLKDNKLFLLPYKEMMTSIVKGYRFATWDDIAECYKLTKTQFEIHEDTKKIKVIYGTKYINFNLDSPKLKSFTKIITLNSYAFLSMGAIKTLFEEKKYYLRDIITDKTFKTDDYFEMVKKVSTCQFYFYEI